MLAVARMGDGPHMQRTMARKTDDRRKLMDAALELAVTEGWRQLRMADIARHARVGLGDALAIFPDKPHLLAAVFADADAAALAEANTFTEADPVRDRLFALIMARFDAMAPHKEALAVILRDTAADPVTGLCMVPRFMASMAHMLEAAGVESSGVAGVVRTKGLAAIYMNTVRAWLRDDSVDLGPTMAVLDRGLRRAEQLARWSPGRRRGAAGAEEQAETPHPAPEPAPKPAARGAAKGTTKGRAKKASGKPKGSAGGA